MEEKITVSDAIKQVIMTLSNIQIPAGWARQIGIPICGATDTLREIVNALDEAKEKEGEKDV